MDPEKSSLDWATESALSEVELRVFDIIKRIPSIDHLGKTAEFMKVVRGACEHDKRRHGAICLKSTPEDWSSGADFGRLHPINIGKTYNITPLPDANVYLVDSTTRPFGNPKPFLIQGKTYRPYLPWRGAKGDKAYHVLVKQNLWGELGDRADEITSKIIETKIGGNGMYNPTWSNEFKIYSPKMCLIYANMDQAENKAVLMLRPNEHYLHHMEYRAYCHVVMSVILKRFGGKCDLNFLDNISGEAKMSYELSMIVKDSMLITKFQRDSVSPTDIMRPIRRVIDNIIPLSLKEVPRVEVPEFLIAA